jgi:hypothetical protein
VRLAVSFEEVDAQGFGFRRGLLNCPAALRVGALDDGKVAVEEGLQRAIDVVRGFEAVGVQRIAMEIDDERVVPFGGYIDAIRHAAEQADFDGATLVVEDFRRGFLRVERWRDCESEKE